VHHLKREHSHSETIDAGLDPANNQVGEMAKPNKKLERSQRVGDGRCCSWRQPVGWLSCSVVTRLTPAARLPRLRNNLNLSNRVLPAAAARARQQQFHRHRQERTNFRKRGRTDAKAIVPTADERKQDLAEEKAKLDKADRTANAEDAFKFADRALKQVAQLGRKETRLLGVNSSWLKCL